MFASTFAAIGIVASNLGVLLAQSTGSDVAPWLSGGGAAAAVAGLAYIAKKIASGELVAVQIGQIIRDSAEREKGLSQLVKEAHEREEVLRTILIGKLGQ